MLNPLFNPMILERRMLIRNHSYIHDNNVDRVYMGSFLGRMKGCIFPNRLA